MGDAVAHQRAAEHGHIRAGRDELDDVVRLINAAGGGEVGSNFSVENSNPMQR